MFNMWKNTPSTISAPLMLGLRHLWGRLNLGFKSYWGTPLPLCPHCHRSLASLG